MTKTQSSEYDILTMALLGFEIQRAEILAQIEYVQAALGKPTRRAPVQSLEPKPKRHMSDATRALMAAAQKKRHTKIKRAAGKGKG